MDDLSSHLPLIIRLKGLQVSKAKSAWASCRPVEASHDDCLEIAIMVYYIRFLKPPKFDVSKGIVRSLVTVTTDLGDDFYPGDLTIYAIVVATEREDSWQSVWQTVMWKSGMRSAWIEIRGMEPSPLDPLHLVVNTRKTSHAEILLLNDLPEILDARSESFRRGGDRQYFQAGGKVERRYRITPGYWTAIYEEIGESIARHLWDAGIALAAHLSHIVSEPKPASSLSKLLRMAASGSPKVLELGSGCGIVGLQVAHLCPSSEVLLTDLYEAMGILNYNVEKAGLVSTKGQVATAILDWDAALPDEISRANYDLVIVSDCTYNSDSIPALVQTLTAIISTSPAALVAVSMKVRHDSEAIFFDLMGEAGLGEIEHSTIPLPDRYRSDIGQPLEVVDVYVYGKTIPNSDA